LIDYSKDDSLREIYLLEPRGLMGTAEQLAPSGKNTNITFMITRQKLE
jgi:hypothetical protein